MNGAQVSAFQANSGIAPSAMATVLVGVVFAVLLVWGVWAIRTAYVGWSESRLNQRQFLGVVRPLRRDVPRPDLLPPLLT
jgi:integrating conjugative element protein (TIGR03758 family)